MSLPLFVYGTLCHAPLREVVLGQAGATTATAPASLPGYVCALSDTGDYPVLVAGNAAEGLVLMGLDAAALARADYFELGFGYRRDRVAVTRSDGTQIEVWAYLPGAAAAPTGKLWDLADWADSWAAIWTAAAREAMAGFGDVGPEVMAARWPMMKLRAATGARAGQGAPAEARTDFTAARDVTVAAARRPYTNYFSLEELDLSHRRFDGAMSPEVTRAGFVGGDAATVLPYDAALDAVLVVEQFRVGPLLRGDPRPWTFEPIAGRIDPGESPQDCARREAREETGLEIGRLHHVADYYPSPGAVTEYIYSYVAEADLDGRHGVVGGMLGEDEDIRAHVLPFDRLMALIQSGEAGTGPLILTAWWLAANRAGLRAARQAGQAGSGAGAG